MYKVRILKTITPTLVKQYIYCPVIPWIIMNYNVEEPATNSMEIAKQEQRVEKGRGQIHIHSNKGYTIIDEIIKTKHGEVLVERKRFKSKSIHRYVAQALTQYIIAKNKIKNIREIIIDNGGEKHTIPINQQNTKQAKEIIKKLEETINNEKPPSPTTNPTKCRTCWYKKYCPYN